MGCQTVKCNTCGKSIKKCQVDKNGDCPTCSAKKKQQQ